MRTAFLTFFLLLAVSFPAQAKLRVVGTLPDFAAIAEELGGERVETSSLIKGTQDPHFVDAKPSMILEVNRADLLICIGMGLEDGWLPVLITQSRNGGIQPGGPGYLDASTFVTAKEVVAKPDRAMGDVHGQGNPHYYTSPTELFKVAEGIHARLVQLDPEGKADYDTRWQRFSETYQRKTAEWLAALAPLKGTKIVEYHKSWIYLLDWIAFSAAGALEPVPGVPPSPSHVSKMLGMVKDQNLRFVFQEIYQPTNLSRIFAEKAGAKLLILPSMVGAEPGIKTFWDKFDRIVELLNQS